MKHVETRAPKSYGEKLLFTTSSLFKAQYSLALSTVTKLNNTEFILLPETCKMYSGVVLLTLKQKY